VDPGGVNSEDALAQGRVVIPGNPDPHCGDEDSSPAFQLVDERLGNLGQLIRTYELSQVYCLEPVLQVDSGTVVNLGASVELQISVSEPLGDEEFEGIVDADFDETVTMELFSSVPGITFELVGEEPPPSGNQPPTANAGPDQTVEATAPTGALVTLTGGASTDPNGDPLSYSWTGPFGSNSGVSPQVPLGFGTHTVTLTVMDSGGLSATDTVDITVRDTTAPVVTPPADVTVFATGDTTVVTLGTATATDAVGVVSGPSPNPSGPFAPGQHLVTWTATDAAGNVCSATQLVTVRLDFAGFLPPVDPAPVLNTARAGRGLPVKWQVRSAAGGYISDSGHRRVAAVRADCVSRGWRAGRRRDRRDNRQLRTALRPGCRAVRLRLADA
jgi:hypothetical protein